MTKEERDSCINTVNTLRRLALNIHGVIDVIDSENCDKIINMLKQTTEDKPQGDLEAIRQEIEQAKQELKSIEFAGNSAYRYFNKGIQKSLSIINKYLQKGESEG